MADVWFRVELHTLGGIDVRSDITEPIAQEMLSGQWRYTFPEGDLSDREKVARMLATQVALAVDKGVGMFVLDGLDGKGQKWLVPNAAIGAICIIDSEGRRAPGYGRLDILASQDNDAT
jgi:hypothetical protein